MKFAACFLILIVCLYVDQSKAQCASPPRRQECFGRIKLGAGGSGCVRGDRWAFNEDTRQCDRFTYEGCFGNNNRFCTRQACLDSCK